MFFQCTSGKWSSEISSQKRILFGKSEAKCWTESPNRFLKNSEKESLFGTILSKKTLKGLCEIIAFDWLEGLEKSLFRWKRPKIDEKWVIFWVFFVRFCPQVANHIFSLFFHIWSHTLSPLDAKNHVFSHVFHTFYVYFGRLGWIPESVWRGDYRGEAKQNIWDSTM